MVPGESVTDGGIESSDSRVADMCFVSHLMTGIAILEQSKDGLRKKGNFPEAESQR